jgi:hypothetical protein
MKSSNDNFKGYQMQTEEELRRELLAEVESIAPVVAEQAAVSDSLGRLSEPTMAALRGTRLLRYWCARELGGLETAPVWSYPGSVDGVGLR